MNAPAPTREDKEWAKVRALMAMAGFVSHLGADDRGRAELTVSRWASTRSFADPAEAEAWLERVTGEGPAT